ncbi:MAG: DivIVA domain-containing protein, partial [Nocardioidaceae bacterium]
DTGADTGVDTGADTGVKPEPVGKVQTSTATDAGEAERSTEHAVPELPVVRTAPEASGTAARLLEIASTSANQLVDEAKGDADTIVAEARTKADRLHTEAKSKAERVESDARTRSEKLDAETSDRRQQMFGQLEIDRDKLSRELEDLRAFEREYRTRLKGYFEGQLRALDGQNGDGEVPLTPSTDGETPRRLRELLGEESPQ